MVTGLEMLAAGGLLSFAAGPVECTMPKAPEIEAVPRTSPTHYDYTKGLEYLNTVQVDTVSPYGNHAGQLAFGLHEGTLGLKYETKIGGVTYPELGLSCLYYDKIKLTIELDPVIYVAREFRKGSCPHRAILAHEEKHVRVDRMIANQYVREIGIALQDAINDVGALGPFRTGDTEAHQKRMSEHIRSVVDSLRHKMIADQKRRQQGVDSKEEYDSVSRKIREGCGYNVYREHGNTIRRILGR
jgi:hypothetical protein